MEHSYVAEHDLIDRYVRGGLPPLERTEFEEHFVDCQACLDQLELAKSLREGIKISAAVTPKRSGWSAWLERLGWWRPAVALAAALVVIAGVPSIILYRNLERTRGDLARERMAASVQPSVYLLTQTRGSGAAASIQIPASPRWIVLSLELDVSPFRSYRATLRDAGNWTVWSADKLEPASQDAIGLSLPSSVLQPGEYTLVLAGRDEGGGLTPVATFPLRATPGR